MRCFAIALVLVLGFALARPVAPLSPNVSGHLAYFQTKRTQQSACRTRETVTPADFEAIMKAYGDAREAGNARKASECFTEDALVSSPPATVHQGRETLFQLFGADRKDAAPVTIRWHNFVYDPKTEIGAVEFTIQYHLQTHSVAFIKLSHGLISNWRQYDVASGTDWYRFVGENSF
jgi:hypothetical protein